MKRLLVNQAKITETTIEDIAATELATGQARLRIEQFALTANNVTYASSGFAIGYWQFFPTGIDGQGIVPVWGFSRVVESTSDVLEVGARLYGFWPFAEELVIEPEAQGNIIVDTAAHRENLPPLYNRYVPARTGMPEEAEALQSLLQPLLATSFLLSDWLQDNEFFEAKQVIVGSASSKTGLGLCKFLSELSPPPVKVVGLTSVGNVGFVEGLGACDAVVSYDDIETLAKIPSVYVDMAGNALVKTQLHDHLGDVLKHSSAVGTSHWDQFRAKQALSGPKPQFFFAPAQVEKRRADWGPGVIEKKVSEAVKRLTEEAGDWLDIRMHQGLEAAAKVYDDVARGKASPRDGHVIKLV